MSKASQAGQANQEHGDAFILINVRTTAEERAQLAAHGVMLRSMFSQIEKEVEGVKEGVEEGVGV
jgi:hypothetical protein